MFNGADMESAPTISIYVHTWGTTVGAEPISAPGILYQQNSGAIALKDKYEKLDKKNGYMYNFDFLAVKLADVLFQ